MASKGVPKSGEPKLLVDDAKGSGKAATPPTALAPVEGLRNCDAPKSPAESSVPRPFPPDAVVSRHVEAHEMCQAGAQLVCALRPHSLSTDEAAYRLPVLLHQASPSCRNIASAFHVMNWPTG